MAMGKDQVLVIRRTKVLSFGDGAEATSGGDAFRQCQSINQRHEEM